MASRIETKDYLMTQLSDLPGAYARKMFGEYGIYYQDKVIGMLCDDQLFVKNTVAGREYLQAPQMGAPYPGAKEHFLIPEDDWEDAGWLIKLFILSEPEIKAPKKKKKS